MYKDSSFYEQVHQIARLIPKGRVTTYGAIAKALGVSKSSRMVGNAMAHAHDPRLGVPGHRVVNSNGMLTGKHHFDSPTQMQQLLEAEGIIVKDDQVQHFGKVFWDPLAEI